MASNISQIDKPQCGQYPKRAELPDVNYKHRHAKHLNTESLSKVKKLNGANKGFNNVSFVEIDVANLQY